MGKPILSPGHMEQATQMCKEGKTKEEITNFFMQTYHIAVPKQVLYGIKYKLNKASGKVKSYVRGAKKASKAQGGGMEAALTDPLLQNTVKDIFKILGQIHEGYQRIFKHLRLELLKSRGQVYQMIKGAGIEMPDEKEPIEE